MPLFQLLWLSRTVESDNKEVSNAECCANFNCIKSVCKLGLSMEIAEWEITHDSRQFCGVTKKVSGCLYGVIPTTCGVFFI